MMNLKTKICDILFKNPIWVASGTFRYGEEFTDFLNLNDIGAIVTKTITLNARQGNPPPRIVETASGLLNSIGLENDGAKIFKQKNYTRLKQLKTKIIISIAGEDQEEFIKCVQILTEQNFPSAFELNLSCPNVMQNQTRYKLIAQDPHATEKIVSAVKQHTKLPVIAKLTPNVTDIVTIAKAAEVGGADAISLANTYLGMAINTETRRPLLSNIVGGLSGPAIKPLALRAVWEVHNHISIPIIGIGGIMTGIDVAEFMLCGACAVQVGTANLIDPNAYTRILQEFKDYLKRHNIKQLSELIGKLDAH
jgi:dihydroorotate dehydrogenase (NAD+) catalytic subunit